MITKYKIQIDVEALQDIEEIIDWYNYKQDGLGIRFWIQLNSQISNLGLTPFNFSIRYNNVRCMLIKKFPFLVHYTINESEKIVEIFAIFHTSRNPKIWKTRK